MIIVLFIFSVGVLAVLKLIMYNMNTMNELEIKTTATLLAKEGLELTYNTRDSNRIAGLPRDCIVDKEYYDIMGTNVCKHYFLEGQNKRIVDINTVERSPVITNDLSETKLFINNNWSLEYTHVPSEQPTQYSRYIYFTGVKDHDNILNTWKILKVESHVIYQRWSKTGEVVLESFIWNY